MVVNSNATTMLSTTSLPSSTEELYADDLPSWLHALAFITYVVLFVFAFVVDLAILFVFWRAKELRNITNNLLCNMVAADLLFALQTPLEGVSIFKDVWESGDGLCKVHRYVLHVFYYVVIISLTIVSIERYLAICQPIRFKGHEAKFRCGRLIFLAWITSLILSLPQLFLSSVEMSHRGQQVCMQSRPDDYLPVFLAYHVPKFILLYIVPLVILIFTYAKVSKKLSDVVGRYRERSRFDICSVMKMRRSIIRMLLVVVIVFFVCLTPFMVIELLHVVPLMKVYDPFGVLMVCVDMLAFLHAVLNPVVSSFLSKEFRKAAKRAFNCPKKFDLCNNKRKSKKNNKNCKLKQMKQNHGMNEGKVWRNHDNLSTKSSSDFNHRGEDIVNEAATLSFETLTETTDLPKEDE